MREDRKSELASESFATLTRVAWDVARAMTAESGGWERVRGSEMKTRFRDSFVFLALIESARTC